MAVSGTINVSASFLDSAQSGGVESEKKLTLSGSNLYTTGKVAIVSGTIGTSNITIQCSPMNPAYRDASGAVVSFSTVRRIAFQSDRAVDVVGAFGAGRIVQSDGDVSISRYVSSGGFGEGPSFELDPGYSSGTANFTVLIYGD